MIPVIALVGRPNVGKSTLFNCLTASRDALVADMPGVTRDRQYGDGKIGEKPFIIVDMGGIFDDEDKLTTAMEGQVDIAIADADIILFVVDGQAGLTGLDHEVALVLRRKHKPLFLVMNKADGQDLEIGKAEFAALGLGEPIATVAAHKRGIHALIEKVLADYPVAPLYDPELDAREHGIKFAIVGRPNVGKSTLVNRILGEERVIAYDMPGTTRDSIMIPFERQDKKYTIIDTAGIRRNKNAADFIEKFSIAKALQAIKEANVAVLVIDAVDNLVEQDLSLLGFIIDSGTALVIAINKWDGLDDYQRDRVKEELHRRLVFASFAKSKFISALHGTGVGDLFKLIHGAYDAAVKDLPTSQLTKVLEKAIETHQPPMVNGRRIKLRYAHAGGKNPPRIIIHGNQVEKLPKTYIRYLEKTFRDNFRLEGTPVFIELRSGENPYEDQRNVLTERQQRKKKRLIRHVKKNK